MEYQHRWLTRTHHHRSPIAEVEEYITPPPSSRNGKKKLLPHKTLWTTRLPGGGGCKNFNVFRADYFCQ
jgi:hypothetical protein